jgi:hypothetical protein
MVANIFNSPRAVAMSAYFIRAFVKMREDLASNAAILKRLAEIDKTLFSTTSRCATFTKSSVHSSSRPHFRRSPKSASI